MSVYKLALVGLGGVGKSCLAIQFIFQRFVEDYDPTLEDSYRKQVNVDGEECLLDIFDTTGVEDFSAVRDQYIQLGEGFLCIYSVTYSTSFKEVMPLYEHILMVKDVERVPIVLVGNKTDLVDQREISTDHGKKLASVIGCKFFETSAKKRINVLEAFHELVREVKRMRILKGQTTPKRGSTRGLSSMTSHSNNTNNNANCTLL
eukprot:TRINITY_DN3508_c0_g1_i1.p1 TRINITY_DN3508_c0_g1~~TRINITY_DN3508_c0_g1_i1.p1  ORF type:complete len:204 (+),score=21.19 TRINITY_DN3508_c0_g1_i1:133-744(+)